MHVRYSITVPVTDSEGKARKDVWKGVATELTNLFGGATVSAVQDGYWKSETQDAIVHDQVRVISTLVEAQSGLTVEDQGATSLVQNIAHEVAVDLKQEAVLVTAEIVNTVEFIEQ